METSKIINLNKTIDYAADSIVSKIITKSETGNVTLFAFDKGQELSKHSAPFDAYVICAEGKGEIIINEESFKLEANDSIIMPANIPHAVKATEKFKMLLVMIKEPKVFKMPSK